MLWSAYQELSSRFNASHVLSYPCYEESGFASVAQVLEEAVKASKIVAEMGCWQKYEQTLESLELCESVKLTVIEKPEVGSIVLNLVKYLSQDGNKYYRVIVEKNF